MQARGSRRQVPRHTNVAATMRLVHVDESGARRGGALLGLLVAFGVATGLRAEPQTLRWGGDEEGGAPYIYRAADGSNRLLGFEVELVDTLAASLGRTAQFRQCQWDDLLKLLGSGGVDIVVNGYELTPERLAT